MTSKLINSMAGVALVAIGVAGLHFNVDHAGWIIFIGLVLVL